MTTNNIETKIAKLHGGSFVRVAYKSDLPLKAEYKNKGCIITKVTEKTCRFGVNYFHIETVKQKREKNGEPKPITNNYEWIIPNRVCYNTKTGKKYIAIANFKNSAIKTKYIITDEKLNVKTVDKLNDIAKDMVIASYFSDKKEIPEVQKICMDNVLSINHSGRECFI